MRMNTAEQVFRGRAADTEVSFPARVFDSFAVTQVNDRLLDQVHQVGRALPASPLRMWAIVSGLSPFVANVRLAHLVTYTPD